MSTSRANVRDEARESARVRRAAEGKLLKELEVVLGLARYDGDTRRDKASIVHLATTFLKCQEVVGAVCGGEEVQEVLPTSQASLDTVVMVVTEDLEVIAVSDSLSAQLGVCVVDLLGGSLADLVHPSDHSLLRSMFTKGREVRQVVLRVACRLGGRTTAGQFSVRPYYEIVVTPVTGGETAGPSTSTPRQSRQCSGG